MIYLNKILPLVASPLVLVLVFLIWGTILKKRLLSLSGVGILILCSLPVFSHKLIAYLEKDYALGLAQSANKADAIVVLSGMVRTIDGTDGLVYEWGEASDRIFAGIDLFAEGKAPKLILTGGKLPWSVGIPEGEYLAKLQ